MYKARFNEWSWAKNASRPDWLAFARLRKKLDDTGLSHVCVQMHNKIRNLQDLRRYLKSHDEEEAAFFDEAATADIPVHVQCCDANGNHLTDIKHPMQLDVVRAQEDARGPSTSQATSMLPSNTTAGQDSGLVDWESLRAMMAPYTHPQPTETSMSHDELQASYVAACMGAGVYGAARKKEAMEYCLHQVLDRFRQMCESQNPFILTAANWTLTWLLLHANGSIPGRIMTASFHVATEVLGNKNPVCVLLEWMSFVAAADQLKTCPINSATLQQVWHEFKHGLGEAHGHTIVATYCLSFHLMLADKEYAQAEQYLDHLAVICAKTFGPSNILTINTLATLSRAQQRQKKYDVALTTIEKSLVAAPLGPNHPHRLELLVRKALVLWKLGRMGEMEELYWVVARGRVATLGIHHRATMAAHDSLVDVLHLNNTWEAKKGDAQQILIDPQVTVSDYESLYCRIIEANRANKDDDRASSDEE